jgi:hypothetical protein
MPNQYMTHPMSEEERFWTHVNFDGPIPEHCPELGPCWIWTASKDDKGYGYVGHHRGEKVVVSRAHRFAYQMAYGPIPTGMQVCHHCDNPPCVNPAHHFLGTHLDNARDAISKGRHSTQRADFADLIRAGVAHRVTIQRYGKDHPNSRFTGERNSQAKLTEDDVREIRKRYVYRVVTLQSLAAEFNVSFYTINQIVRRKAWKHID